MMHPEFFVIRREMQEYYLSGYYEALWFFGGAIIFGALMKIFNIIKSHKIVKVTVLQSLILLLSTLEDIEITLKIKYDTLSAVEEIDKEILDITREADSQFLEEWKLQSIQRIKEAFPSVFKAGIIEFDTWDEAMTTLRDTVVKK
tara:strand:+ start:835 stop:1269 length:435 start_codon:yes stop_codon:yes gene_type:complete